MQIPHLDGEAVEVRNDTLGYFALGSAVWAAADDIGGLPDTVWV